MDGNDKALFGALACLGAGLLVWVIIAGGFTAASANGWYIRRLLLAFSLWQERRLCWLVAIGKLTTSANLRLKLRRIAPMPHASGSPHTLRRWPSNSRPWCGT